MSKPDKYKAMCDSIFYCPRCKEKLRVLESLKFICLSCGYVYTICIEDRIKGEKEK